MGFWSGLGKIASVAAPIAAAPFTGGLSLAAAPSMMSRIAGGVANAAPALTAAAAGSRDARNAQNTIDQNLYNAQVQGLLGAGQLELAQRKFAAELPMMQAQAAARGDLMQNVQDFSMGGPAGDDVQGSARANAWKSTGGLRPSALGADAKEAARLMVAQQLEGLKNPTQFDKIKLPELPKAEKGGVLEGILGGVGLAGSVLGGIHGYGQPQQGTPQAAGATPPFVPYAQFAPTPQQASVQFQQDAPVPGVGSNRKPYSGLFG